jgi:hypothetical protein
MIAGGGIRARERTSARWLRAFVLAVAVCTALFALNVALADVRSDNAWGLGYGIAAALLMLAAFALGLRRRTMRASSKLRLGRSRTWLLVHVYGGLLSLVLVLMHAEFRLPVGVVSGFLYWLSLLVVASGLFGLALQKWIPRMLASGLSTEVLYERIPDLVVNLRERAEAVAAEAPQAVRSLWAEQVAPQLDRPRRRVIYLVDPSGGAEARLADFAHLGRFLEPPERAELDELAGIYRTKLELDAHYTLQSLLRGWHWMHVPASAALMAFLVLHILSFWLW